MRVVELPETETVAIRERERPRPGPADVLVRVEACGVCATDYHMYRGAFDIEYPHVPGHESAGEIETIGEAIDCFEPGDRVAVNPSVPCYECERCRANRENLCPKLTSIGGAATTIADGAFAEYVCVPASNVEPIGDLPARVAAFAEPLGCCVHAIDRVHVCGGESVAVIGAGPIGLLLIQTLRARGAGPIAVTEPIDRRRELTLELGADYTVDPRIDDPVESITEAIGHVDVAIEAVGFERTIQQAEELTRPGGSTLVFGVPPEDAVVELSPFDLFYEERQLLGTYSLTPDSFERAIALLRQGRVDVEPLITDEYGLEGAAHAFEQMATNAGLKQMIYPGQ